MKLKNDNKPYDCDEKCRKINLNSDNDLSFRKTLQMFDEVIFIRSIFTNNITFYTQVFLEECSNKLTK